jgi:hypothetical protein
MRELEFLPEWYPRIRKRSRIIKTQGWLLLLLIVAVGAWLFQTQRAIGAAETTLGGLKGALAQSQAEQQLLDEQLHLRTQLQDQQELIASLGYPVEMTRLLQTLDSLMPKEMSLIEFDCQTEETPVMVNGVAMARGSGEKTKQVNRRMKVKLAGVVPSDVDVANLLAAMTNVLFFQDVAPTYSRVKSDDGHVFREFEVTFWIDLNTPTGN